MEDKQIVELYWQRSEEAIPATAAKYGAYCRTIAYNILTNDEDAEECVSDTWLGAWNSMPDNRPTLLGVYLGKLTRWLSLTRLRERGRLKRGGGETSLTLDELAEVISDGTDIEHELERRVMTDVLRGMRREYDEQGLLVHDFWWEGTPATVTRDSVYSYDENGRIQEIYTDSFGRGWERTCFEYDEQGRLTAEIHTDNDDPPGWTGGNIYYEYDVDGNCRRRLGWQDAG